MESMLGDVFAVISAFAGGVAVYCFWTAANEAAKSLDARGGGWMPLMTLRLDRASRLVLYGACSGIVSVIFLVAFVYVSLDPAGFAAGFVFVTLRRGGRL